MSNLKRKLLYTKDAIDNIYLAMIKFHMPMITPLHEVASWIKDKTLDSSGIYDEVEMTLLTNEEFMKTQHKEIKILSAIDLYPVVSINNIDIISPDDNVNNKILTNTEFINENKINKSIKFIDANLEIDEFDINIIEDINDTYLEEKDGY